MTIETKCTIMNMNRGIAKGDNVMLAEKYKQEYRAWKADVNKQAEEKVQAKIIMLQQSEEQIKKNKITTLKKALNKGFDLDEGEDLEPEWER